MRIVLFGLGAVIGPLLSLTLLFGCGQDLCVAGMGSCGGYFNKLQQQPAQSSTGTLAVGANPIQVVVGGQSTITAAGGQPPYTFSIVYPVGGSNGTLTQIGNTGTYVAPATIPVSPYTVTIQATDANNNTGTTNVNVTAQ